MFERDIVKSRLQVDHTYPLGSSKLRPVSPGVIQLVLVFIGLLIDGHYILAYPVRLTGLLARY